MPRPNFFNDNINRTFPFRHATAGVGTPASGPVTMLQLPDELIADCGFVMGPESGFVEGIHSVFLFKVSRLNESRVDFEFRCDSPALSDTPLIFSRNLTDPFYVREFVESDIPNPFPVSQSLSLSESIPFAECGEPFWSGYLVTGRLDQLANRLAIGQAITRTGDNQAVVEPALIQNLDQNQLVSLNIANADRTRADRPDDCPPNVWAFPTGIIYVNQECLQGDIRLRSGYNMALSQDKASNTIQFAAAVNAGAGQPCEQVKLFEEETPPIGAGNNLLAGDYYCNEVLRTINGLAGPNLTLYAGTGVAITPNGEGTGLVIDINLVDLSLCTYSAVSESI
jgi:hypothetical protein